MATSTRAQLRNRVLEHLGILAAGQSPSPEDASIVDEAIDSAHDRLRALELAPFELTAIPEWAQTPMRDYVAGDVGRSFGFGDSLKPQQVAAERDLARQVAGHKPRVPVRVEYF